MQMHLHPPLLDPRPDQTKWSKQTNRQHILAIHNGQQLKNKIEKIVIIFMKGINFSYQQIIDDRKEVRVELIDDVIITF